MNELKNALKRAAVRLPPVRRFVEAGYAAIRDHEVAARHHMVAQPVVAERRDMLHSEPDDSELWAKTRLDLPDGDPAANGNIADGRNITAGYTRGFGIQSGNLIPAIRRDPDYIAALAASRGRSIVLDHSLMNIFLIIKYSDVVGNIIEFGSYNGGSVLFMACLAKRLRPGCKVFALDTFAGMPDTDAKLDYHRSGDFADATFDELTAIRDEAGLDNLILLKGLFQDTVPQIKAEDRQFFLSHIDCDIYASVKFSTEWVKQYAVRGSYIIFDDPLYSTCLGAMKAVEQELVQKEGVLAEQVYPHLVYRFPAVGG